MNTDFRKLRAELEELDSHLSGIDDRGVLYNIPEEGFLTNKESFKSFSDSLGRAFENHGNVIAWLQETFAPDEFDAVNAPLDVLECRCVKCIENIEDLDNWCGFTTLRREISDAGAMGFVDDSIIKNVPCEDVPGAFRRTYYTQLADSILHGSPLLMELSRVPHDRMVEDFKGSDMINFSINEVLIRSLLSSRRPNLDYVAVGSPAKELQKHANYKRKQKNIRKLMEEMPEFITDLKPCFLMSPLSASTYLDTKTRFDVVVFDEASQIFPWDALGSIYRGNQIVVVGDDRQMPPTNFFVNSFTSSDDDGDDDEEFEDIRNYESILSMCSAAFPQKRLRWHYRSRYEQLIAFSNKNFYDNDLITFPSSETDRKGIGVDYVHVNGVFDRKSKTNRLEAERVVDLVFENFKKYPERTVGVVTFNEKQQDLIDNLITMRRRDDRSGEEHFKTGREGVFIKNLETVQGDERDTIIFSVAYGKDSQGRLLHNFGPINQVGGERRLNVAITRARQHVVLVSSMRHEDIDLTRTGALGVKLLKEYLDYAENGGAALERSITSRESDRFDSEFEMEVCDFLRDSGFCVDTNVGCSSFRIDLALKKPYSSDYYLAVECDGATYHSSKNARDRDRLRQSILENLGWRFYRIWSTDWFKNNNIEKKKLIEAATMALETHSSKPETKEPEIVLDDFEETKEDAIFPTYKMVVFDVTAVTLGNERETIRTIVAKESPVSDEWLLKRMLPLYGDRVTKIIKDSFSRKLDRCTGEDFIRKGGFIYNGKEITQMRVPADDSAPREIKHIAPEELACGLKELIKQNGNVSKKNLYQKITRLLGFQNAGKLISARLDEALETIPDAFVDENDNVSLRR